MELFHKSGRSGARNGRRIASFAAIAATLALVATGCAATSDDASSTDSAGGDSPGSIVFLPKQLNNPYTDVVLGGGDAASEEIGFDASTLGPLEASASAQVPFIEQATQEGANVIVIAANDPDAVGPSLQQAREAGAKIVAFDSDTNPDFRDVFVSQVVAKDVALVQLEMINEQLGEAGGDIAILSATATATNQNEWIKFMEEELASNPDYANLKLVTKVYGDDDADKSFKEAQGLMQSYPDLKGIISPTTVGIAAAAKYLSTSDYKGKVALTGLGLPNEMREFVKDGTVSEFALWDPAQLGYVAAYAGQALVDGTITGAEGDTFTAGDLGEKTVGADGIIVVGPPTKFNADNIDDYDF
ncbi:rhamnose ABC transporter substrate-binding protein [Herbiconiux sp. P17]|uniref:rhamnose ABC transporter substrate-binding protein n=1 Tax=Herbiconiux wuyangfengii TaxID=3342794 RepID=UPI0035B6D85A